MGESIKFCANFKYTYLSDFTKWINDEVMKNYLRDQEKSLACTRNARARLRAQKLRAYQLEIR